MRVEIYGDGNQETVSGPTVQFTADDAAPVTDLKAQITPSIAGYSAVTIAANGQNTNVSLTKSVYGGSADITTGVVTETHGGGAYNPTAVPSDLSSKIVSATTARSASGSVASFNCSLGEYPMSALTAAINPVQDLHGYDHPWPGGGGKNKVPKGASSTSSGITFIIQDNGEVVATGKATSTAFWGVQFTIPAGTYILNGCPQGGGNSTYLLDIRNKVGGSEISGISGDTGNGSTFTISEPLTAYLNIRIASGYSAPSGGLKLSPMIRLATEADSTFAPYSNICPISGRTWANIHVADSVAKYGVQFSGAASAGTRLYDAVGKVANVGTDTQTATNDFDNILPWSAMRRCNTAIVNGERVPTYYEGEAGFDNVNSDVFVYCPLFFYYRSDDDNTHVVSMSPLRGYRAPSKFVKADGTLRPYVFLPAYTAGVDANGVPVSRPGYWPHCISLTAFMTLCKNKHTAGTLDADIWIESTKDEEIIRILLDIEYATRDHQTVMQGASSMYYAAYVVTEGGTNECTVPAACAAALVVGQAIAIGTADKGNQIATNVTVTAIDTTTNKITLQSADGSDIAVEAGHYISSRPWKSGACDSVLTPSGSPISNTNAKMPCKYRGIENPWGNQYRWRWDYLQNDHQPYVLDDPDNYTGSVNEHYTALSYTVAQTNGYAVEMGFDENFPHCRVTTSASGGSSTTYFADYYYQNSGVRALRVGGDVSSGRSAGARFCNGSTPPGGANWNIGAALSPA